MTRRKIHEAQIGETKVELFRSGETAPLTYADGVHGFTLEDGKILMDLFAVDPSSTDSCQQRNLVGQLVIPVPQFVQFARSVSHQAAQVVSMSKVREIAEREVGSRAFATDGERS